MLKSGTSFGATLRNFLKKIKIAPIFKYQMATLAWENIL